MISLRASTMIRPDVVVRSNFNKIHLFARIRMARASRTPVNRSLFALLCLALLVSLACSGGRV